LVISRALQAQLAESSPKRNGVLAFPGAAHAAGRAVSLLVAELGRLRGDDRLLQSAQQFPGFRQRQTEILGPQLAALEHPNFFHGAESVVVTFDHELNTKFHTALRLCPAIKHKLRGKRDTAQYSTRAEAPGGSCRVRNHANCAVK
jgi:hypothetical protein